MPKRMSNAEFFANYDKENGEGKENNMVEDNHKNLSFEEEEEELTRQYLMGNKNNGDRNKDSKRTIQSSGNSNRRLKKDNNYVQKHFRIRKNSLNILQQISDYKGVSLSFFIDEIVEKYIKSIDCKRVLKEIKESQEEAK